VLTAFRGTPLAVFEPNAYPGLVNRWMAPYAERAFVNFEEATRYFAAGKAVVIGIPVRGEFFQVPAAGDRQPFTVLVFGGSQGARSLNRAVMQALPRLAQQKPALALLHQQPAHPWTLEKLARGAGLSRSALAERFNGFVGQPPMQYLTRWRIQLAAKLLAEDARKVSAVAMEVGYDSEAAFSRAFKKSVGVSPAAWRDRRVRD